MPRTALAVQEITRAGLTPSYSAANVDGHSILNGGREVLHVKTGGTACTVTIQTPGTVDGQAVADRTVVDRHQFGAADRAVSTGPVQPVER